jgi:SAM-dependent methyltransferase
VSPPQLFDRRLFKQRRSRYVLTPSPYVQAFYTQITEQLQQRLILFRKDFETGLVMGPFPLAIATTTFHADSIAAPSNTLVLDEEWLPFAHSSLDIIVSFMGLHAVNDLPGVLKQFRYALRPDGLFLAAFVGEESLQQLRHCFWEAELQQTQGVSPRVMPLLALQDAGSLLQRADFGRPVVDKDSLILDFPHPEGLISFLRAAGLTNILHGHKRPLSRSLWQEVKRLYQHYYPTSHGGIMATFDIVYMTGMRG